MSSTPREATPTPPRRQSCDRCHGQKLRCTRAGDSSTGACQRCLRQGAKCIYSPSLPKGRPTIYRATKSSTIRESSPDKPSAATPKTSNPPHTASLPVLQDFNKPPTAAPLADDLNLPDPLDASTWPWSAPLEWSPLPMDGLHMDSVEQDFLFPALMDCTALPSIEMSLPPTPFHTPPLPIAGLDGAIAKLSQLSTHLYPLHRQICTLADMADTSGLAGSNNPMPRRPLVDNDTFQSVIGWLGQTSGISSLPGLAQEHTIVGFLESPTTGDILRGICSASQQFLDIISCMHTEIALVASPSVSIISRSTSSTSVDTTPDEAFWGTPTPPSPHSMSDSPYFNRDRSRSTNASLQHSRTAVRHLVTACHSLLLNIYLGVLIVLQHDAELSTASTPPTFTIDPNMDPSGLADIRLVMLVQLCSYLVGRLHQAVEVYSTPQVSSPPTSVPDQTHVLGNPEVLSDLDMEVSKRLAQLRMTLRI